VRRASATTIRSALTTLQLAVTEPSSELAHNAVEPGVELADSRLKRLAREGCSRPGPRSGDRPGDVSLRGEDPLSCTNRARRQGRSRGSRRVGCAIDDDEVVFPESANALMSASANTPRRDPRLTAKLLGRRRFRLRHSSRATITHAPEPSNPRTVEAPARFQLQPRRVGVMSRARRTTASPTGPSILGQRVGVIGGADYVRSPSGCGAHVIAPRRSACLTSPLCRLKGRSP